MQVVVGVLDMVQEVLELPERVERVAVAMAVKPMAIPELLTRVEVEVREVQVVMLEERVAQVS